MLNVASVTHKQRKLFKMYAKIENIISEEEAKKYEYYDNDYRGYNISIQCPDCKKFIHINTNLNEVRAKSEKDLDRIFGDSRKTWLSNYTCDCKKRMIINFIAQIPEHTVYYYYYYYSFVCLKCNSPLDWALIVDTYSFCVFREHTCKACNTRHVTCESNTHLH